MPPEDTKEVRVRFAPSPTGLLHIGGARTALFNYLFTKKNNGTFILRIEDTDKERSKKEYEDNILESLSWLGVKWDELYRQSERLDIYKNYLKKLLDEESAYVSDEREGESKSVIRLKNPGEAIKFNDLVRGDITFNTGDLGDFVIAKNLDTPLYHFAVVVDDFEMKITHVIRGEEHLSNTPRQILIARALKVKEPSYAHLPLILSEDKSKMSKRQGEISVTSYREAGYLPGAIVNFIAFLGWSLQSKTNEEIFSLTDLEKRFDLGNIQKGGAIFNIEKLNWVNKQHIKRMPKEALVSSLLNFIPEGWREKALGDKDFWEKVVSLEAERLQKLCDIKDLVSYFFEKVYPGRELLLRSGEKDPVECKKHLTQIANLLNNIPYNNFSAKEVRNAIWNYAEENGRANVLWPMRVALTAKERSPDPFLIAGIMGKEEVKARILYAASIL
ncbi:MAG TPA: glutamate--tRNA ligase [Candidatus Paceibacterota bacterium]